MNPCAHATHAPMQVFDPTDLAEDLTPAACVAALAGGAYARAALIALRLKDAELLRRVAFTTPVAQVGPG